MPVTLALTIAVFAVGVDSYIVAAVLPAIADDLHEPIAAVGLLASAYNLPTAIFSPIFGPFSDRRGRRAAMLLGLDDLLRSRPALASSRRPCRSSSSPG